MIRATNSRPRRILGMFVVALAAISADGRVALAEYILAARYFTSGIDIYDPTSNTTRPFINISPATDAFPGLTGLAYSGALNRLYATANNSQRIYSFNAQSGALIGYQQLSGSFAPAGIALDPSGDIYVADNGGTTVQRFTPNPSDASLTVSGTIQFTGAASNLNGLARTATGNLLVSAANGSGVYRYDSTSGQSTFNSSPIANGQVAIAADGTVAVGGVVFSSYVSLLNTSGTQNGLVLIDNAYLPQPALAYTSADVTSPQGVAFNGAGNLIIAAMGRTNPFSADDNYQSNGGIFVFDSTGTTLLRSLVNTTPYTGVIVSPVPEPSTILLLGGGFLAAGVVRRSLVTPKKTKTANSSRHT